MSRRESCSIPETTRLKDALPRLTANRVDHQLGSFIVVVDDDLKVIGTLTDSDLRRANQRGVSLDVEVSEVMNRNFIAVRENQSLRDMAYSVHIQIKNRKIENDFPITYIPVLSQEEELSDILHIAELLSQLQSLNKEVFIFGQGFVGLTLALALADNGERVFGVESDEHKRSQLNSFKNSIYEPGLDELLQKHLNQNYWVIDGNLSLPERSSVFGSRVYIVAVGTPANSTAIDLGQCIFSLDKIGSDLRLGDLVLIRSTVPVGFTRRIANYLQEEFELIVGKDYFLCYAPERTVEGNALRELRQIPQLVAGLTEECAKHGATFFAGFAQSTVVMENLESCELGKLSSNSFRDTIFAFSNELALIASEWNLDINRMIESINSGYPRNFIPNPSPGVGGPCLTKDSYMLSLRESNSVVRSARKLNEELPQEFANRICREIKRFGNTALVIGLAFKGMPPTNDFRSSPAIETSKHMISQGIVLRGLDLVDCGFQNFGITQFEPTDKDFFPVAIVILNNHERNLSKALEIADYYISKGKSNRLVSKRLALLIDPWNLATTEDARDKFVYRITMSSIKEL